MSKRLQVLLDERDFVEIRHLAQRRGLTVAEWVRQALSAARRESSQKDPSRKLAAIREAAKFGFPTSDIHTMLAEIERGYGIDPEK